MHEMERAWNKFIRRLLEAERAWDEFRDKHARTRNRELLSVPGQRIYGLATARALYMVALPRILDFARRGGGLESLLIPGNEAEDEEVEQDEELIEDEVA